MDFVKPTSTHSFFADPKRATKEVLESQISAICSHPLTSTLLCSLDGAAVILNQYRQVVAANDTLLKSLKIDDPKSALGLRPGEVVACQHALSAPNGCGTGKACSNCGAVLAILAAQKANIPVTDECYITACREGEETCFEFRVRATPLCISEHSFLVFTLNDIRKEKWAETIERVFLHDMLNYLQVLRGSCELFLFDEPTDDPVSAIEQIQDLSDYLIEITGSHRDLLLMERGQYRLSPETVPVVDIMARVNVFASYLSIVKRRTLETASVDSNICLTVDQALLVRVLLNMVKNALEATPAGGTVRFWHELSKGTHVFRVWNAQQMTQRTAILVFQRNFSTKSGQGRGMGTYSMKLLGERYLGGKVRFQTSEEGTVFEIELNPSSVSAD